jgi:phage protein D
MSGTWPTTPQAARCPRWRVLLSGTTLTGCLSVSVHKTNHRKPSTFSATFALDADPDEVGVWFDAEPPISVEIQAGLLPPGAPEGQVAWQSLFVGEIEDIHLDPVRGTIEATGRDLMGRLIDARIEQAYPNNTASEVVTILAGQYGLTADVDATTERVGAYYQIEHDAIAKGAFSKATSPNDLILFLARCEGFDYWVDGTVLHFKAAVDLATATPLQLVYSPRSASVPFPQIPVVEIKPHRSCVMDKGVKVTVKSWMPKDKKSHEQSYPPGAKKDAHEYVYIRAGWSPDRAMTFAQAAYADIVRHQRTVDIALPGEFDLTPRSVVTLSGLPGTSFNIPFFVDEMTMEFSMDDGFRKSVVLKNQSPQSDAAVG